MVKEGGQGVEGGERDLNKQNPEGWRQNHMQLGDGGEQQFQVQVQPQQQPPPKQCPRCGSNNTKFCYYNNHKLTQPRYLCKNCRRHWTQGGILRSIPVGSSSRKGKHAKNSSSSRSQQPPLQPPSPSQWVVVQTNHPNLTTVVKSKYPFGLETPFTYPLYQGDSGYLSSMPADPSLNPSQSHPFDQSRKVEDDVFGCSSNLGHTSGSKVGSLSSIHQIRPLQFYQMGGEQREVQPMYASQQGLIVPSSMSNTNGDVASHNDRPHNNVTYNSPLWSTINNNTTFISGSERNANVFGSTPLIPNQWPDFSGFGPPPSSD